MELSPFTLAPVLVERPWGGRGLARFGKELPPGRRIGESWEVADLPGNVAPHVSDPRSRVASGPFAGRSLSDLIGEFGARFLGSAAPAPDGGFPLLVKLLDAHEHLSIQVHPDADYVSRNPNARLKTESWYVLAAEPGAELFLGVDEGVTLGDIEAAIGSADLVELLRRVPAHVGDFHHLPAGLVHALGAGVMVAEVQTPSDTTFRLYDWPDEYGRAPRPLHARDALQTITLRPPDLRMLEGSSDLGVRELEHNDHYWVRRHHVDGAPVMIRREPELLIVLVTGGELRLGTRLVRAGTTAIVPAEVSPEVEVVATGEASLLEIGITSGGD